MAVSVSVKIDKAKLLEQVRGDKLGNFAAESWAKRVEQYVPMDSAGVLYEKAEVRPWEIEYPGPYARYLYGGIVYAYNYPVTEGGKVVGYFSKRGRKKHPTNKALKFQTGYHMKACAKWDKVAEPVQKPILIREIQAFIDRGV